MPEQKYQVGGTTNKSLLFKSVPDPFDCFNIGLSYLLSDFSHVNVDRSVNHQNVGAPHPIKKVLSGKHTSRAGGQKLQQLKLLSRHMDFYAVGVRFSNMIPRTIDVQVVDGQNIWKIVSPIQTPQNGLYLTNQDRNGDWFCKIKMQSVTTAVGRQRKSHCCPKCTLETTG